MEGSMRSLMPISPWEPRRETNGQKSSCSVWEMDVSADDPLGEFVIDDSDLDYQVLQEPKHFAELIVNPEEGSMYEIGFSIAWSK